jgi:RHS repeat-associated protein
MQSWPDNRIGFLADRVWRYDACGNRIAQMHADHRQQQLHYDGAHQLIAVRSSQVQGNAEQLRQHSRYTYDALGRRLKQQVHSADGAPTRTHYYGWDGDRLIHTERLQDGDDTRHLEHTVYEPGSFTPLVRLSTTASGHPQHGPHLLVQAIAAGLPDQDDSSHTEGLALMQNMLSAMPREMQQEAARHLRHAMEHGLPDSALAILGDEAENTARMLSGMQTQLQQQEKEQYARIAIHHYHCDHLGTPLALTDRDGCVVWAVKLDPWGNVQQEYNPQGIHQAIRLPGQHHDRETGLYYNRHRYYDPVVGAYINQDPIGLRGGIIKTVYADNKPNKYQDPLGLEWQVDPIGRSPQSLGSGISTIFCDGKSPEIFVQKLEFEECPGIKKCTEEHEKSHLNDALNFNKNICANNSGSVIITNSDDVKRLDSERRAMQKEIQCLSQESENETIPSCKSRYNSKMRIIDWQIKNKVDAGNYP